MKKVNNENELENMKEELNDFGLDNNDNIIKDDSKSEGVTTDEEITTLAPVKAKKKNKDKKKRKTSDSSDSDEKEHIPHGSLNDSRIKKQRKHKKERKDLVPQSEEDEDFKDKEDSSVLLNIKVKSKSIPNESKIDEVNSHDLETSLESIDEKKKRKKKERKKDRKVKDSLVSENKIVTKEHKDNDVKKRKKKNQQGFEEVKIEESIEDNTDKKRKQKSVKILKESTAKKLASNEKRLKAVKERETNSNTKQSIISSALQNMDANEDKEKNTKHIKFDEEDEEQEGGVGREKKKKTKGKV